MKAICCIGFLLLCRLHVVSAQDNLFRSSKGTITFVSDAPLELISATSVRLEGVMDIKAGTFAFSVPITSFEGFNNGLQRQHFYENYMEADKYPVATFSGKFIDIVDLKKPGTYTVRAKGQLTIHGRSKERILRGEIISTGNELKTTASFTVPLIDHQIEVPKIVNQKIAEVINVQIQATFQLSGRS